LGAAVALHMQGHNVFLFERFEAPRPLGSGIILQPTGLTVLKALGCGDAILKLGHIINSMSGISMPAGKCVLNVDYSSLGHGMHGLAVHRAALFEVLYARVNELNMPVLTDTEIVDLKHSAKHVDLVDSKGKHHGPFDLVVDASGAKSSLHTHAQTPPARRMLKYGAIWSSLDWPEQGFRKHVLDQRYVAAHTMVGVLPIGRHSGVSCNQAAFFWSLPSDDYAKWKNQGLDYWKKQVRSIWPETETLLDQITSADQLTLAQYGHHTLSKPYGKRIVFIGDSAHATSPQLGQGANMGLLDAWALGYSLSFAQGAKTSQPLTLEHTLQTYAIMRRLHVRLFQTASLSLTPFYQSDSRLLALLRDTFFDPVSRLPVARKLVAGLVTGLLTDPLGRMGLSTDSITTNK